MESKTIFKRSGFFDVVRKSQSMFTTSVFMHITQHSQQAVAVKSTLVCIALWPIPVNSMFQKGTYLFGGQQASGKSSQHMPLHLLS